MKMNDWVSSVLSAKERQVMLLMTYPGLKITGKSVLQMVMEPNAQYECVKALTDRFPLNVATTSIMDLSAEAEAFGCKINFRANEIPTVSEQLMASLDQVENLRIPAVGTARTRCHLDGAGLAAKGIKTHPVLGGIIGPFSLAGRIYDITSLMMSILSEPSGSHELLNTCTAFLKEYAMAFRKEGCAGVLIAEPAAGLLGAEQCEEFSSRYVKQIVDYVQDDSFMVILHNCGNTVGLVESMVHTKAMGFHFGNAVDLSEILPQVPSDSLVFGNIDPVNVLKYGSQEAIKDETRELLVKTARYNNFVLSSGCDIPPGTDLRNIGYIFEVLEEFNKYR